MYDYYEVQKVKENYMLCRLYAWFVDAMLRSAVPRISFAQYLPSTCILTRQAQNAISITTPNALSCQMARLRHFNRMSRLSPLSR